MTVKVPKTIVVKGEQEMTKERAAGGAITPGHLITYNSSNQFIVHGTAGGDAFAMFALENESAGKSIDTAYATNDIVNGYVAERGDEIFALLPAGAAAVVIGDELESNGDGTLRKTTAAAVTAGTLRRIVARALQAVDNSAGGTTARIIVEVV